MSLLSRLAVQAARAYGVLSSKSNFVSASYLVVAGGGGTGQGGGGAGGLLTSTVTLSTPNTYTITVGAGGAAGLNNALGSATNGSNSVISGTGITTITATGGGRGGFFANGSTGANNGVSGGSGGGGGGADTGNTGGTGAAGTSGQGFAGGNGSSLNTISAGGGGGGAGAVGTNGVTSTGGSGGVGATSSISGTSTYYAGGGSGGGSTTIAGGNGGGGAGGASSVAGTAGTANTGGGGGGGGNTSAVAGGAGGSGIIIISYAGSQAFNGGLVTSSGGNTIHTFLASGVLTPLTNNLTNSLRFRSSASAYLNRTFSTPTNNKIWTWSAWVKRGKFDTGQTFFGYGISGTLDYFGFNSSNQIYYFSVDSGGAVQRANYTTAAVFRDASAWYHVVFAVDTTQATSGNRFKLYVNGVQQTLTTTTSLALNWNTYINSALNQGIGYVFDGGAPYLDGYLADVNFVDGQQLEAYYFGNNDAYGNWKPILYKGTYGTNGFYLTFGNTTSTTTLGYDSSPNANNWTTNNFSLTVGITYDAMTDVPTNTNSTIANYCTLNPLPYYGGYNVISQGNLQFTSGNSNWMRGLATFAVSSGKWYWEVTVNNTHAQMHGILTATTPSYYAGANNWVGYDATGYGYFSDDGSKWNNNASVAYGATYDTGDIIGIAFDADNGKLYFSKNGTFQASGDPAAGTNAAFTGLTSGPYVPAVSLATTSGANTCDTNFGQRPFSYTPPTGFLSLNTFNLSTPAILQGNRYMDATLWTGTGTALNVVNQALFQPDFVWVKNRSSGLYWNVLFDSVRGAGNQLSSNQTDAELASASNVAGKVSAFNSNGFALATGSSSILSVNATSNNYVGWQWQAGQGSSASNTSGSTTSTVSVNTTAGFSIVTYTGTGSAATIGHGLGVAPKMIIVKGRNATIEWLVYHASLGATQYITLNTTGAAASAASAWNNTAPTSSVFSVLSAGSTNFSGRTYVAYCWAEITGFSKFGSYTGNASTDGPFVFTGFRPKFIMYKRTDATQSWILMDTSRSPYNVADKFLIANNSDSEYTGTILDMLSNGFKVREAGTQTNANGGTYIFMAFAENPFKNANAR
jgi:hypothetical protein